MGGVPPPHPTSGSGERREIPSGVAKRICCILTPAGGRWWQRFTKFCIITMQKLLYLFLNKGVYALIRTNYINTEKYASGTSHIIFIRDSLLKWHKKGYKERCPLPIWLGVWERREIPNSSVRGGAPAQNEFVAFWPFAWGRSWQRVTKFCNLSNI